MHIKDFAQRAQQQSGHQNKDSRYILHLEHENNFEHAQLVYELSRFSGSYI